MTAAADDAFWLHEADPAVDICDPRLTVDACLDVITGEMFRHIPLSPPVIVEFGCGIGRLANPLQERYPGTRVVGIDLNLKFLRLAGSAAGRRVPQYVRDDDLGYVKPGGADAIYTMAVLQHLDNDRKQVIFRQAGEALRLGGVVVAQYVEGTHSSRCMHDALIGDVRDWFGEAGLKVQRVRHDLLTPRWTWVTATREAAA